MRVKTCIQGLNPVGVDVDQFVYWRGCIQLQQDHRGEEVPEGAVVFVQSCWSKDWPDPKLSMREPFPGVSLDALKFLHLERKILFQGREPLDTGSTPTLDGDSWRMHNGCARAEGVTNLGKVPPVGALLAIGSAKAGGGRGGYARFIADCPSDGKYGVSVDDVAEAPLPKSDRPLTFDPNRGLRMRR